MIYKLVCKGFIVDIDSDKKRLKSLQKQLKEKSEIKACDQLIIIGINNV